MNKAFEKILNKLEENKQILLKSNIKDAYIGIDNAKEIVKEVAEEYKNNTVFISTKPIEDIYLEAYNKAIDDFKARCDKYNYFGLTRYDIARMAESLKRE